MRTVDSPSIQVLAPNWIRHRHSENICRGARLPLLLLSVALLGTVTEMASALPFQVSSAVSAQTLNDLPPQSFGEPASPNEAGLSRAWSLLREGKATQAELSVRAYLKDHAQSAEAHFFLGYVLFKKNQEEAVASPRTTGSSNVKSREENARASLSEFTEGAKYKDPGAFDLKVVALDYILLKDYPDADKWLTRSLQANPKDGEGWYYLGRTKYKENRFDDAVESFQNFLKLEPNSVKGEDNLGLSYQGMGRTADAIAAYKTAIARQGEIRNDCGPFINLGAILLDQNQARDAVAYLLEAVAIAPQEVSAREQLGKAYDRLGELAKAQEQLERAVELAPQNARLHYVLGQVYRKAGLHEKARGEFDRSTALRQNAAPGDRDQ